AEAVEDGKTGLVVHDPRDPAAIARALARLLDDPALASRQGQAARDRVEAEFSYDRLAERLDDALTSLAQIR
ncbi:MAG TPA: glycosyltransferase, partial [Candidatus Acidoferrales bacterium]|nr:glycosyltransferase [Candidatus Acidoferrales bacterium]